MLNSGSIIKESPKKIDVSRTIHTMHVTQRRVRATQHYSHLAYFLRNATQVPHAMQRKNLPFPATRKELANYKRMRGLKNCGYKSRGESSYGFLLCALHLNLVYVCAGTACVSVEMAGVERDELLIDTVRNYPCIYNIRSSEFKVALVKESALKDTAETLLRHRYSRSSSRYRLRQTGSMVDLNITLLI